MKLSCLIDTDWAINCFYGRGETVEKLKGLAPEGLAMRVICSKT